MDSNGDVTGRRWLAALAGAVSAAGGLAAAEVVAGFFSLGASPVLSVGEGIIGVTPGSVAEAAIQAVGKADKPLLVVGTVIGALVLGAVAGVLSLRRLLLGGALLTLLGVVAGWAALAPADAGTADVFPAAAAVVVSVLLLSWLHSLLTGDRSAQGAQRADISRRAFLQRTGLVAVGAVVLAGAGRALGAGRRAVEDARRFVSLPLPEPVVPEGVAVDVPGVGPWQTPNGAFYRIDTALAVPEVTPGDWRLRIHGLVDREIELGYDDLVARGLTSAWITLACVSNEVGGSLIGNAYWSGVPVADLLAEAGVRPEADSVLQTSVDGWTCSTPLRVLTDNRNSLLAVGMNGEPLPIEHGFPVRMVVPGLYGFVSATKWVVDLEVTRFEEITAFWTARGWAERGPIKTQSRIEVPRRGSTVSAGRVPVGGVAWDQHTGIARVEVQVDDGPWAEARLAEVPNVDTWRQWAWVWDAEPGEHTLTVRATNRVGETQTSEEQGVIPDGATGWHTIDVFVE
ncbi:MAG TPA: molybdopterin-dependent oxidoreductase [Nocardioidaceae bacterium]|nr:molybdopterin-dependent oxidoreductase [Nocardioidaceae bacterium]